MRPPAKLILTTPVHFLAFGFGTGLAPVAPGTFGTLAALPFFVVLYFLPLQAYLIAVVIMFLIGIYLCGESARRLGVHDYGGIVWDEIVGYLITMIPLCRELLGEQVPGAWWIWMAVGFAWFRLFDIVKPWPIKVIDESVHGGTGIMLDDVLAGIFAAGALMLCALGAILVGG